MTELEYYNMALAHIGKTALEATSDVSEAGTACRAFGDISRQLFLKQSKLHLARKEVALATAAGEESERYEYVFDMPSNSLHPVKIWAGSESAAKILYVIETHSDLTSSVVKTDYETPTLIYIVDIPIMNRYSPDDIVAMSYLLASFIVMPLRVGDVQLKAIMQNDYAIALSIAIKNDNESQSIELINNEQFNSIIDSRNT